MSLRKIYPEFLSETKWDLPEVLNFEDVWENIAYKTNLNPELIQKIISYFFLEIKINLISKKLVYLHNLGMFKPVEVKHGPWCIFRLMPQFKILLRERACGKQLHGM